MTSKQYSEIEKDLNSGERDTIIEAILYAAMNMDDPDWIVGRCACLILNSRDNDIQGLAITCIGHVARIHRRIDRSLVATALQFANQDICLAGRVEDALDDIELYTGERIRL
ncbi:hypothetical protein QSV36_16715 [Pseudomonas sp. BCRC 81390]|uniref:hypothetical protein n=1 Tax=Pseudomonas sp. BCRC 81390 TaxID=3054778 RepID=UPI0025922D50|nr:hypothetical protein [Pseudomonas sp. BCRC 81390]MDM3887214.1 hypothetical protein [Pseudomonas sp. BCRC 81390]